MRESMKDEGKRLNAAKVGMTVFFNRDPREIEVRGVDGPWPTLDQFLRSLGFRQRRNGGRLVPGVWEYLDVTAENFDLAIDLTVAGIIFLTHGNYEIAHSV